MSDSSITPISTANRHPFPGGAPTASDENAKRITSKRRSRCDLCVARKVTCNGNASTGLKCHRCERAKIVCFFSFAKKSGPKPRKGHQASESKPRSPGRISESGTPGPAGRLEMTQESGPAPDPAGYASLAVGHPAASEGEHYFTSTDFEKRESTPSGDHINVGSDASTLSESDQVPFSFGAGSSSSRAPPNAHAEARSAAASNGPRAPSARSRSCSPEVQETYGHQQPKRCDMSRVANTSRAIKKLNGRQVGSARTGSPCGKVRRFSSLIADDGPASRSTGSHHSSSEEAPRYGMRVNCNRCMRNGTKCSGLIDGNDKCLRCTSRGYTCIFNAKRKPASRGSKKQDGSKTVPIVSAKKMRALQKKQGDGGGTRSKLSTERRNNRYPEKDGQPMEEGYTAYEGSTMERSILRKGRGTGTSTSNS